MGSHFGVTAPPILVYLSENWDVHWGYDLDFDPWLGSAVLKGTPKWEVGQRATKWAGSRVG